MSAPAQNSSDEALEETIHHEPSPTIAGGEPMNQASPNRYTYTSGARPLDGYTIRRAIGRGGFGEVYYATSHAGKEVALKLITRNLEVERRGVVQCMNLKSPNLVAIHDLKQNDAGDTFVIMEYIAGPSLAQILANNPVGLPANEIRLWLKGLVDGVAYLHDHGIVHRDLKPANMFLEEGVVKIGDYGLTKTMASQRSEAGHSECVGTCHYMAPETSTGKYHKAIDVYAIGVILYEMVTGRVPFDGETVGEVLMKHLTSRPDVSALPEPFRGIVVRALAKDPNHRPGRVTDLLLPGDAPKEPAVRFIGEKSWPPTEPAPSAAKPAAPVEEILRIEAEDSVFYIGPETRPPRKPISRMVPSWVRAANRARRLSPAPRPTPRPQSRPVVQTPPEPEPLGPPPPLPSGRIRVAELAGSMVLAAPILAVGAALTFPAAGLAVGSVVEDPRQIGLLFGMSLLGTWGVQIAGKLQEGRSIPHRQRMFNALGIGAAVGLVGYFLALSLRMDFLPRGGLVVAALDQVDTLTSSGRARLDLLVEMVVGSALTFWMVPWQSVAVRDRPSRFSLFRLLWAGLAGALVGVVFPHTVPMVPLMIALVCLTAQLTTPWNRAAASYRREKGSRLVAAMIAKPGT